MTIQESLGVVAMACALSAGCNEGALGELDSHQSNLGSGGSYYNGQGVKVSLANTANDFGMAPARADWHILGFINSAGQVFTSFKKSDGVGGDIDAQTQVATAVQGAAQFDVLEIVAADGALGATNVRVDVRDRHSGQQVSKSGSALEGLILKLTFPSGGPSGLFSLRFHTPQTLPQNGVPIYGYSLDYWNDANPAQVTGYCHTTDMAIESAVFMTGASIHPLTGQRTQNSSYVDVSCASGSEVACLIWGYTPWTTGGDSHQACLQMKRAAYCGSIPYTNYGHSIYVRDSLSPHMNDAFGITREAYWGPNGALCLDSRRDTDVSFPGCAPALPSCANVPSGWLTMSSF